MRAPRIVHTLAHTSNRRHRRGRASTHSVEAGNSSSHHSRPPSLTPPPTHPYLFAPRVHTAKRSCSILTRRKPSAIYYLFPSSLLPSTSLPRSLEFHLSLLDILILSPYHLWTPTKSSTLLLGSTIYRCSQSPTVLSSAWVRKQPSRRAGSSRSCTAPPAQATHGQCIRNPRRLLDRDTWSTEYIQASFFFQSPRYESRSRQPRSIGARSITRQRRHRQPLNFLPHLLDPLIGPPAADTVKPPRGLRRRLTRGPHRRDHRGPRPVPGSNRHRRRPSPGIRDRTVATPNVLLPGTTRVLFCRSTFPKRIYRRPRLFSLFCHKSESTGDLTVPFRHAAMWAADRSILAPCAPISSVPTPYCGPRQSSYIGYRHIVPTQLSKCTDHVYP